MDIKLLLCRVSGTDYAAAALICRMHEFFLSAFSNIIIYKNNMEDGSQQQ